jgi:hypothetical protein
LALRWTTGAEHIALKVDLAQRHLAITWTSPQGEQHFERGNAVAQDALAVA